MFKKLRNRFLLMNMVIITIIMLVAFATIYVITYQNVRRDIGMELERVSEFYHKDGGPGKQSPGKGSGQGGASLAQTGSGGKTGSLSGTAAAPHRFRDPEASAESCPPREIPIYATPGKAGRSPAGAVGILRAEDRPGVESPVQEYEV